MPEWFSIEVLNGTAIAHSLACTNCGHELSWSARAWAEAYGDSLVRAAFVQGAVEWEWQHHPWGSLLEIEFSDEDEFERFRNLPVVEVALDGVPDRVNGLMIHRGRGGSAGTRQPLRPLPKSGSGSVALPLPTENLDWSIEREPLVAQQVLGAGEALSA